MIENSKFNIHNQSNNLSGIINLNLSDNYNDSDAMIINTEINGFKNISIAAYNLRNLTIGGCSFITNNLTAIAMDSKEISDLIISDSYFRVPKIYNTIRWIDENLSFRGESIKFVNCTFVYPDILEQNSTAIAIENNYNRISSLIIENCSFTGYNECVYLLNLNNINPLIRNNSFIDFKSFGINATNGRGLRIINNQFISSSQAFSLQKTGIFLSQISYPHIISNNLSLQGLNIPGAGISLVSSNGEIRGNNISGFKYGIELGSSSPNIGANVITSNTENGIYVGAYSNPNLSYTIINDDVYPLSGYNTIRENGLCNFFPSYSEIYLTNSNIQLKGGCNTIADDREDPALHCNHLYLIDGDHIEETIYAAENYWGEINNHNPEGRFGENITVEYEGYLNEPCNYSSGSEILLLTDQNGEVFDTVYSSMNNISQLSDIETRYAMANSYFYAKEFNQARYRYENIIDLYGTIKNSLKAYLRLYEIATLINSTPDEFNQLHQFYLMKASIQTDSVMIGVLKHLSSLCIVWSKNYEEALARFENDIQTASNNDIALYRLIDILTTSLLIEPDSLVGKRVSGYLATAKNSSYSEVISELLSTRGKSALNEKIKIIPEKFILYQNYPNPFNPSTKISWQMPVSSRVTIKLFDILGREIETIIDGYYKAGFHSTFYIINSTLPSGVYFYQLQTDNFRAAKKMVMLR
ncbi:MAG: right-handed parallel beta-helix repeat-containing protein [Ignavibacterium sp.]|nr:right-handed parallel beta-helix repeat-containing protein [Ignavibacterium sp.]